VVHVTCHPSHVTSFDVPSKQDNRNANEEKENWLLSWHISIFEPGFCSEGTIENSPAFSMPGPVGKTPSPAGTAETNPSPPRLRRGKRHFQSSLRDSVAIPSDPGVQTPGYFQNVPAGHGVFRLHKN
jgi:hypothetical protein